jgi:predicted ATP-dependent endonuclease of OLD family
MRIKFVEVQNFRKLKSIRIDFSDNSTLFVGANNSGKTSAMLALGHFLVDPNRFTTNDFTLSNWAAIETIGAEWEAQASKGNASRPTISAWDAALPSLDVWLEIAPDEIHYAIQLLPTLDWTGGLLGVRLRFEPNVVDDFYVDELYKEYLTALKAAKQTKLDGAAKSAKGQEYALKLWPENMRTFLDRKLRSHFAVRAYLLDPAKREKPTNGNAKPQLLPSGSGPIDGNPLDGLIRIDEIAAQRGLGESGSNRVDTDGKDIYSQRERRKLSEQLRSYYSKHLDPSDSPEPADLDALEAIESSQNLFDARLADGFSAALKELESLNYPGVTDPKLKIATRIRPTDGLNHSAAVQYEVLAEDGKVVTASLRLPEEYNGLGYQNLISIVFKLMSFRDAWMRVGKAGKTVLNESNTQHFLPPLHLVLVEEPEAHLHPQVQQVFVREAYGVLRNHTDLRSKPTLQTQLIVSTHSSHVAHESQFSCLRYFRRLPPDGKGQVPTSAVINLSEVFGPHDETEKFVTRYLRATHCDLFFADAAILVEGPAERMLVPHFIRKHFPELHRSYVTLLEVGGSHAHRLRPLIEHLGLTTLIITDIDSVESSGHHKATPPKRGCNQLSGNATLKKWHPLKDSLDELLDLPEVAKVKKGDVPLFAVRVAYQIPITVKLNEKDAEALATTFEDSLAFENIALFKKLDGGALAKNFKAAVDTNDEPVALSAALFKALEKGGKAEFALDLLVLKEDPTELQVPRYIREGLAWLEMQLRHKPDAVL